MAGLLCFWPKQSRSDGVHTVYDLQIKDNSKKTPLDIARAHRHEAAVSILKFGAYNPPKPPRAELQPTRGRKTIRA